MYQAQSDYLRGKTTEFEKILAIFKSGTPEAGRAALTLGKLGNRAAVPALAREVLAEGQYSREAMISLRMLKDPRTIPLMIHIIYRDGAFASDAVQFLGDMKSNEAVPTLIQVVQERRPYHLDAIAALGKIGDPRAVPILMEFYEHAAPQAPPKNIQFRVIQRGKENQNWQHVRTFSLTDNLPPKIEITNFQFDAVGIGHIWYQINDTELDTVSLYSEYSKDNGKHWLPASTIGSTDRITSRNYRGTLQWQTSLDSIIATPDIQLVFRITPSDGRDGSKNGVPAVCSIGQDVTPLQLRPLQREVGGQVLFPFYYPAVVPEGEERFMYQYSLNGGNTWLRTNAAPYYPRGGTPPDTQWVAWNSVEDLPGFDSPSVLFRISSSRGQTLGHFDQSKPLHLDNNTPPSITLDQINEKNIMEINYTIFDPEQDTVGLLITYSRDGGVSWERATMSGNLSHLGPHSYVGTLRWYDDFDIPGVRDNPIRIRITPYDNDLGNPAETPVFYLKDAHYAKPTYGERPGDIEVRYYYADADSSQPLPQYSTDGGKTWVGASISTVTTKREDGRLQNKINWEINKDIPSMVNRLDIVSEALSQIQDSTIIPNLIILSLQKENPNPNIRQRAIQAFRILDSQDPWVVNGLLKLLWHEQVAIRQTAAAILHDVDRPDVQAAIQDYYAYWKQDTEFNQELAVANEQAKTYETALDRIKKRRPSNKELVELMKRQGMAQDKAKMFLAQLDAFREEKTLKSLLDQGKITEEEYHQRLGEILIRLDKQTAEAEKERKR